MNNLWILAEAAPNSAPAPAKITAEPVTGQTSTTTVTSAPNAPGLPAGKPQQGPQWSFYAIIILMFVVLYFMMVRGPQKKRQEQRHMIQSLKKNDRVQTIGGMLGTVLDVKDDQVLVKVDENTNAKIWFVSGAISRVLSEEKK
jgi:preprotein translocase subunit YajC